MRLRQDQYNTIQMCKNSWYWNSVKYSSVAERQENVEKNGGQNCFCVKWIGVF